MSPSPEKEKENKPSFRNHIRRHLCFYYGIAASMLLLLLLLCMLLSLLLPERRIPHVELGYVSYRGKRLPNGVDEYRGMRYAQPPLGNLRWRAPKDASPIKGVQDANEWGPICYGTNHGVSEREGEDCLFVNVWAPSEANEGSKLPVWVFIQGGGYTANSNPNYSGSTVVEKSGMNMVFVNFNYRVGLWGFLGDERVREDGDLNVGLLDQRHLLKWVQKHISKFGGDPDHVVIHGASAGAGSVALHLAAYGARDDRLFSGAIAESVFFPAHFRVEQLGHQFNRTLALAGCDNGPEKEDPMACLRGKDSETLQRVVNSAAAFPGRSGHPRWYWAPCVDDDLIRGTPSAMFESGEFIKVPVMFGTSTNEGSIFAANARTPRDFAAFMQDNFPGLTDKGAQEMLKHYPKMEPLPRHNTWFPSTSRAYGEATFICPANLVLDSSVDAGLPNDTWSYRYNVWDAQDEARGLGVTHTFDKHAILGPKSMPSPRSYFSYNAAVVPVVMGYYISFVRALDPNVYRYEGSPEWRPWGKGDRLVMETNNTHMEVVPKGERERCEFWSGMAGDMQH